MGWLFNTKKQLIINTTITEPMLRKAALRHLERFSCSVGDMRRVLHRKAQRYQHQIDHTDNDLIEKLLENLLKIGLLDDRRFAEGKIASLASQGKSISRIGMELRRHAIDSDIINEQLAKYRANDENIDLEAARRLAQRRQLGPYRIGECNEKRQQKDMAILGRAGFSRGIIRQIFDGD